MRSDRCPRLFLIAGALLLALLAAGGCNRGSGPTFRVGYMICNAPEETRARFAPLTEYLARETGASFVPVYLDTMDVEEAFEKGEIDFVHSNSLLYAILAKRHGAKLVAAERRGAFGAMSAGAVVVRADSPVKTLADLRGKRIMFGPAWAPFGFLSQYAMLLEAGVDPERDLGPYAFPGGTWQHEKIIYSVLYGAYDAGAAPMIDLEEMAAEGKIAPGDLRVVARSELAPYCTFSVASTVSPEWADKVRKALLALDETTTVEIGGEELKVLKAALVDGFDALAEGDYEIIHRWAKRSRLPPYDELP